MACRSKQGVGSVVAAGEDQAGFVADEYQEADRPRGEDEPSGGEDGPHLRVTDFVVPAASTAAVGNSRDA